MDTDQLEKLALARTRVRLGGVEGRVNGFRTGRKGTIRIVDDQDVEHELPDDELELVEELDEDELRKALEARAVVDAESTRRKQQELASRALGVVTVSGIADAVSALGLSQQVRAEIERRGPGQSNSPRDSSVRPPRVVP